LSITIDTPKTSTATVYLIEKLPGSSDHWFPVGVVETKEAAIRYVDRKNCGSTLSGDFYQYTEFNLETAL
jgi:hypothetical protein